MKTQLDNQKTAPHDAAQAEGPKRPYKPPHLTRLGDLREVTLGPSAGIGESGNPMVFRA